MADEPQVCGRTQVGSDGTRVLARGAVMGTWRDEVWARRIWDYPPTWCGPFHVIRDTDVLDLRTWTSRRLTNETRTTHYAAGNWQGDTVIWRDPQHRIWRGRV